MVLSIPGMNGNTKTPSYRLLKHESNDEQDPSSDHHDPSSNTKATHWSNPVGLRLAIILLILSFSFNIIHLYRIYSPKPNLEFTPEISYTTQPVIFNQDRNWAGDSPSADENWDQYINNAPLGFITIPNPQFYNLKPGVEDGPNGTLKTFSVTLYHQLHCLAIVRRAYYNPVESPVHDRESRSPPSAAARLVAHIDHCFDYLRQGITCASDMAVEWAKVDSDGSRREVDGWGIPHRQCRDPEKVEAFMKRHRVS